LNLNDLNCDDEVGKCNHKRALPVHVAPSFARL